VGVAFFVVAFVAGCASSPPPALDATHLPVFVIDTFGGGVPDEPKAPARLRLVVDGYGGPRESVGYAGRIGIERRGQSSQSRYPKPQFGFELRDADGDNVDAPLLGLPPDDDWVLHGPYGDKSLVRNALAFHLARRTGRYASRTRFCEVVLDGDYLGVYLLLERIEQGRDRVDIRRLRRDDRGPTSITGGYVFKLDKDAREGWESAFASANGRRPVYVAHDPKPDDLSLAQKLYLSSAVTAFEETMASDHWDDPERGYPVHLDVDSFVDHFLLTELSRDVDGYRVSTYFTKAHLDDGGKIHAGPVWDFNIAFGNADYHGGDQAAGWQVDLMPGRRELPIPAWWPRLVREPAFHAAAAARLRGLRAGPFHPDTVDATIDRFVAELGDAPARNFARWPTLGLWVWPNPVIGQTHAEEVALLKAWIRLRAAWMDGQLLRGR